MALDGTFVGLKASVADFLNRTDLTLAIPDFITLAEAQMNRKLRVRRMVIQATATVSTEFASLPSDFAGPISVTLSTGQVLDNITPDKLAQQKYSKGGTAGTPTAYAVVGTQFQFEPAPSAATVVDLIYYQKIPAFSLAPNWVSANFIDAYLYGTLVQSAPYLQDDERLTVWGSLFTVALQDIEDADRRESYGSSPQSRTLLVV